MLDRAFYIQQRSALAERAAANAAEVEKAYGGAVGTSYAAFTSCDLIIIPIMISDNSDEDLSLPSSSRRQQKKAQGHTGPAEEEFEDEEQLATVTVVEDFDPDTIIHGPTRVDADPDAKPKQRFAPLSKGKSKALSIANAEQRKAAAKANMAVKAKKSKPKNTPYETKADRGIEKRKQRARRTEKAERAGGKGSGKATRKPYGGASGSGTRAKAPPGKKR